MHLARATRNQLATLLRSCPVKGRWRVAPVINRLFRQESVQVYLNGVGQLHLDLEDEDQLQIFWTGLHPEDTRIVKFIRSQLPGDGVFVDVGANIGIHTLAGGQVVEQGMGKVIAFEPHPANYQVLTQNLQANDLNRVQAENVGLSDAPGEMVVQGEPSAGNWSLASQGSFEFQVALSTLDDYARTHPFARLDLIKIDVEGSEEHVIVGAEETLTRFRPLIVFEVCPHWLRRMGTSVQSLMKTIHQLGYQVHSLADQGKLGEIADMDRLAEMDNQSWTNLVAVPR